MNNDALDDGRNTIEIDKKLKTRSFNLIQELNISDKNMQEIQIDNPKIFVK